MTHHNDKTVFIETFGCQMNFLDSELVIGQLRRAGFTLAEDRDTADVILFNTCAVRDHAEQKVTSRLGELRAIKAARPNVIIGVLGCQAEREGKALISRFPHVDVLCGPNRLNELADILTSLSPLPGGRGGGGEGAEAGQTSPHPDPLPKGEGGIRRRLALSGKLRGRRDSRSHDPDALESLDLSRQFAPGERPIQAFVRVQRGCDKFCAYCVVPAVRGPEVCRPPDNIIAECRKLADAGCREITLLGQTVNSYVADDSAGLRVTLARLVERVAAIPGLARVRFVTNYPGNFDEDIFRVMAGLPNVCPYLHIPAQSGSDRMLAAMRRRYTAADYYRLIDRAHELVPNISLAGDFIVGFPGETDADFAATAEMVRRVRYKNCFVFKYSPRPGTAAWHTPDDVPDAVKRERNNVLLAVQAEVASAANAALVGQLVSVLIEGASKKSRGDDETRRGGEGETERRGDGEMGRGGEEAPCDRLAATRSPDAVGAQGSAPRDEVATPERPRPVQLTGRTTADQIVVFDCPAGTNPSSLVGRLADLRVQQVTPYTLLARLERLESAPAGDGATPLRYKSITGPK